MKPNVPLSTNVVREVVALVDELVEDRLALVHEHERAAAAPAAATSTT